MSLMALREKVSSTPSSRRGPGGTAITFRLGWPMELRTKVLTYILLWHPWGWLLSFRQMLLYFQNSFLST